MNDVVVKVSVDVETPVVVIDDADEKDSVFAESCVVDHVVESNDEVLIVDSIEDIEDVSHDSVVMFAKVDVAV